MFKALEKFLSEGTKRIERGSFFGVSWNCSGSDDSRNVENNKCSVRFFSSGRNFSNNFYELSVAGGDLNVYVGLMGDVTFKVFELILEL
jgi:hypothetical protein